MGNKTSSRPIIIIIMTGRSLTYRPCAHVGTYLPLTMLWSAGMEGWSFRGTMRLISPLGTVPNDDRNDLHFVTVPHTPNFSFKVLIVFNFLLLLVLDPGVEGTGYVCYKTWSLLLIEKNNIWFAVVDSMVCLDLKIPQQLDRFWFKHRLRLHVGGMFCFSMRALILFVLKAWSWAAVIKPSVSFFNWALHVRCPLTSVDGLWKTDHGGASLAFFFFLLARHPNP